MSDGRETEYRFVFEASPEFLALVDEVRREATRDAFLHQCLERGLGILLREARPDLAPRKLF